TPVKKGQPIFQFDQRLYQDKVNAVKAELAAAEQHVLELKATLDAASSAVAEAKAHREALKDTLEAAARTVSQAKAQRESLKATLDVGISNGARAKGKRELARSVFQIAEGVQRDDTGAISKLRYTQAQQGLAEADADFKLAGANEVAARTNYETVAVAAIEIA